MLYRNQEKGIVAGVAKGISERYGISVTLLRVLFVLSSLFLGLGIICYMALILALPETSGQTTLEFE